jgi:hypothetical protein
LLGYGELAQLRDQSDTLVLSALAALAGWLVLRWLPGGATGMAAAIAAAVIVYLAGAASMKHGALADLLSLARTLRAGAATAGTNGPLDP